MGRLSRVDWTETSWCWVVFLGDPGRWVELVVCSAQQMWFHRDSIMFTSGLYGGHDMTRKYCPSSHVVVARAMWGGALFCWNTKRGFWWWKISSTDGTRWSRGMPMYWSVSKLPSTSTRCPFLPHPIQPQNMIPWRSELVLFLRH